MRTSLILYTLVLFWTCVRTDDVYVRFDAGLKSVSGPGIGSRIYLVTMKCIMIESNGYNLTLQDNICKCPLHF